MNMQASTNLLTITDTCITDHSTLQPAPGLLMSMGSVTTTTPNNNLEKLKLFNYRRNSFSNFSRTFRSENGPRWAPMGPMGPRSAGPRSAGPGPCGPWGPWGPCGPLGPLGPLRALGPRAPAGPMGPAVTTVSLVPCGGATPYYLSIKIKNKKPSYKQTQKRRHTKNTDGERNLLYVKG